MQEIEQHVRELLSDIGTEDDIFNVQIYQVIIHALTKVDCYRREAAHWTTKRSMIHRRHCINKVLVGLSPRGGI